MSAVNAGISHVRRLQVHDCMSGPLSLKAPHYLPHAWKFQQKTHGTKPVCESSFLLLIHDRNEHAFELGEIACLWSVLFEQSTLFKEKQIMMRCQLWEKVKASRKERYMPTGQKVSWWYQMGWELLRKWSCSSLWQPIALHAEVLGSAPSIQVRSGGR